MLKSKPYNSIFDAQFTPLIRLKYAFRKPFGMKKLLELSCFASAVQMMYLNQGKILKNDTSFQSAIFGSTPLVQNRLRIGAVFAIPTGVS